MIRLVVGLVAVALALIGSATAHAGVVINEIMYQPSGIPENVLSEFIELFNPDAAAADVSGWQFTKGVNFVFPPGTTIPPQGYLVVVPSVAAFKTAHPGVANVAGNWIGTLSNTSEEIRLVNAAGVTQDKVTYADSGDWAVRVRETTYGGWDWASLANGSGRSLELRNPALDNDTGQNWGDSTATGGTPGTANTIASTNIGPIIRNVTHFPAVPKSVDNVTISCDLTDETAADGLAATLFWRNATTTTPGAFQSVAMTGNGTGGFSATLSPLGNLQIVEFYVQASDGLNTRTWPAPTSEGQNANCQYQVSNEVINTTDSYNFLVLTAAENLAFNSVTSSSDRQFNQTFIAVSGSDTTIRYRSSMRIRGNSSRTYQFRPMRVSFPRDTPFNGSTVFNLNPRSSYIQYLGLRLFQAAGLRASDSSPVELRRNGLESTTSSGTTPDYGKWVRVEDEGSDYIDNHWPEANGGNIYKKGRPDRYWRNTGWTVPSNADGLIDGWSKQNNGSANDWSDLTGFFAVAQTVTAPHFPGSPVNDSAGSTGSPTTGTGTWNSTTLTASEITTFGTVADLDQWARWFAVMTILQDIETNISNGEDDDYGIYFVPSPGNQRRAQLVPHDLDTIFGLGDTQVGATGRGLFDMTETGSVFRPLLPLLGTTTVAGNAEFRTKYFTAIRELYGSVFNADTTGNSYPPFYAFVDNHLTGWASANAISAVKAFATSRQTFLLNLIGSGSIAPPVPTSSPTFTSSHGEVMISEVLANNVAAVNSAGAFPDIIELYNTAGTAANLTGRSITDDPAVPLKYVFPSGSVIPPGGYLVLYADSGTGANHLPFALSNGGDAVYLYESATAGGAILDSIVFGTQPPDYSIGRTGAALETWSLCTPTIGAANAALTGFAPPGTVRINEWLGNPDYQFDDDFLELYNPATLPVAIGGMSITDDFINYPSKRTLPPLSYLAPTSYLRMDAKGASATAGDTTELPFGIDGTTGWLALIGQNGAIADSVDVVSQPADTSTGRSPDGATTWARFGLPTTLATPGLSNVPPPPASILALMNGLRITEILYRPDNLEYIELQNIGNTTLDLAGVRFTKGVTYTFGAGATLAPGAFVVICKDRAAFQTQFGTGVPLAAGQFTGSLSNTGETIAFQPPAPWEAYILNFDYDAGWYAPANSGYSLAVVDQYRSQPGNWDEKPTWAPSLALGGTPGSDTPPAITSNLAAASIVGNAFQYQITATKGPTSYSATGLPAALSINTTTGLISGTTSVAGTFNIDISATNVGGTDTEKLVLTVASSGPLTNLAWTSIASPQRAGTAFPVTLRAVDSQGRTVVGFSGAAAISASTSSTVGTGTTSWELPLGSLYHDARTQSIYLASELGGAGKITALALDVTTLPGQTLNNWTIRMKHTTLATYATNAWEGSTSGWTTVYQQNQVISSTGLVTFTFTTPFDYNGTNNLMIDFSFNNSSFTDNGQVRYTATPNNRSLYFQSDSLNGNPLNWSGSISPPPNPVAQIPNLKLTRSLTSGVSPTSTGSFVSGVWSGNLTVSQTGTGVTLRADDGASHVGTTNSFDVGTPVAPVITSPVNATAVIGRPFSYQIIATNLASSYGATSLPANLTINTATGLISGTPMSPGNPSIGLSATGPGGTGGATLSLLVQDDTDGDGIGDAWETAFGLNPGSIADAALDNDGDGQSNLAEWLAGTAPNNPSSRFSILGTTLAGTDVRITWSSAIGKRYRVLTSTNLTIGSWTELTSVPIVATDTATTWTHSNGFSVSPRYYRIELVP